MTSGASGLGWTAGRVTNQNSDMRTSPADERTIVYVSPDQNGVDRAVGFDLERRVSCGSAPARVSSVDVSGRPLWRPRCIQQPTVGLPILDWLTDQKDVKPFPCRACGRTRRASRHFAFLLVFTRRGDGLWRYTMVSHRDREGPTVRFSNSTAVSPGCNGGLRPATFCGSKESGR